MVRGIRFLVRLVIELIQPRLVGPPDSAEGHDRGAKECARLRSQGAGERVKRGHEEYWRAVQARACAGQARARGGWTRIYESSFRR